MRKPTWSKFDISWKSKISSNVGYVKEDFYIVY